MTRSADNAREHDRRDQHDIYARGSRRARSATCAILVMRICAQGIQNLPAIAAPDPSISVQSVAQSYRDPHDVLGVSHDADDTQVKKAYKRLSLIHISEPTRPY